MLGLGDMNADQLASKLEETLPVIRSVSEQFKDPVSDSQEASAPCSQACERPCSLSFGEWPVTLHLVLTQRRSFSLVSHYYL